MTSLDPIPVPNWLADVDQVAPCPCGRPLDEDCIPIEGETGLGRWFHTECIDWIEYELDDEEIEEKHEWERRMRQRFEGGDDE